jgi:hypothetical protein
MGTTQAVSSNSSMLRITAESDGDVMMGSTRSSDMSVLTRATRRHTADDGIIHMVVRLT